MMPTLTPDQRYLVIEGRSGPRLWRASNPFLPASERQRWVDALMDARRAVKAAKDEPAEMVVARAAVDQAKHQLGERGPPWWTDGAPDFNRCLVRNTPYRDWWAARSTATTS
jgi:hypothetical protein